MLGRHHVTDGTLLAVGELRRGIELFGFLVVGVVCVLLVVLSRVVRIVFVVTDTAGETECRAGTERTQETSSVRVPAVAFHTLGHWR